MTSLLTAPARRSLLSSARDVRDVGGGVEAGAGGRGTPDVFTTSSSLISDSRNQGGQWRAAEAFERWNDARASSRRRS